MYESRRLDGAVATYFFDAGLNLSWIYSTGVPRLTIPEPAAGLMVCLGFLAVRQRRRRSSR
jgi:hypothetical protein